MSITVKTSTGETKHLRNKLKAARANDCKMVGGGEIGRFEWGEPVNGICIFATYGEGPMLVPVVKLVA